MAGLELERENEKGKCMWLTANCWQWIMQVDIVYPVNVTEGRKVI
jgi:hypothetical protein